MGSVSIPVLLIGAAALGLGLIALGGLPMAGYARAVERRSETAPDKLRALNNAMRIYGASLGAVHVAIGFAVAGLAHGRSFVSPALRHNGTAVAIVGLVGLMVLMGVVSLVMNFAVMPSMRRIRGLDETAREGPVTILRGLAVLFLPIFALIGTTRLFSSVGHGNRLVIMGGQIATFLTIAALAPLTVRLSLRTYAPDDALTRRVLDLCSRHGVQVRGVRLYRTRAQRRANALFVGIVPSRRYIYVADYLVDNFSGQELDAILAHEICHGKEHHLVIRVAIVAAFIVLANVLRLGLAAIWLLMIVLGFVGRAFERRADDYAARTAGSDVMVGALRHLGSLNDTAFEGQGWGASRSHPTLARRITRLGGTITPEEKGEAKPRRRRPRLPVTWRIALPIAWVATLPLAAVFASGTNDVSISTVSYNVATTLMITAVFAIPIIAGIGWRWAPAASFVGAASGLVAAFADARYPNNDGPAELMMFGALLLVSVWAVLDRRVRRLTWQRR